MSKLYYGPASDTSPQRRDLLRFWSRGPGCPRHAVPGAGSGRAYRAGPVQPESATTGWASAARMRPGPERRAETAPWAVVDDRNRSSGKVLVEGAELPPGVLVPVGNVVHEQSDLGNLRRQDWQQVPLVSYAKVPPAPQPGRNGPAGGPPERQGPGVPDRSLRHPPAGRVGRQVDRVQSASTVQGERVQQVGRRDSRRNPDLYDMLGPGQSDQRVKLQGRADLDV